jgi:hypothetical protein
LAVPVENSRAQPAGNLKPSGISNGMAAVVAESEAIAGSEISAKKNVFEVVQLPLVMLEMKHRIQVAAVFVPCTDATPWIRAYSTYEPLEPAVNPRKMLVPMVPVLPSFVVSAVVTRHEAISPIAVN